MIHAETRSSQRIFTLTYIQTVSTIYPVYDVNFLSLNSFLNRGIRFNNQFTTVTFLMNIFLSQSNVYFRFDNFLHHHFNKKQ
jgi:hypothetical protein